MKKSTINIFKTNKLKSEQQLTICFLLFFSKVLNGIAECADYFGQTVQQTERKGSSLHLYLDNSDELLGEKQAAVSTIRKTHPPTRVQNQRDAGKYMYSYHISYTIYLCLHK